MSNIKSQNKNIGNKCILVVLLFSLLILSGCFTIQSTDVPSDLTTYQTFETFTYATASANINNGDGYFAVEVPLGWTVNNMSYSYTESGVYTSLSPDSYNNGRRAAQAGYKWEVFAINNVNRNAGDPIYIKTSITSDDSIGDFELTAAGYDPLNGWTYASGVTASISCDRGGAGTSADPITICTCEDLQAIGDISYWSSYGPGGFLDDYYELGQDIDCSDTVNWVWEDNPLMDDYKGTGTGFIPIATSIIYLGTYSPFLGVLEGNGYTISNLYSEFGANKPEYSSTTNFGNFGLFSEINYATIQNLHLENFTIFGSNYTYYDGYGYISIFDNAGVYTGALAGQVRDSTITNVSGQNISVYGKENVGGLVGFGADSFITNSFLETVYVQSDYYKSGGIFGLCIECNLSDVSVDKGNIVGQELSFDPQYDGVGGIGGRIRTSSSLINVHFSGNVSGKNLFTGELINSVGGLIGSSQPNVSIINSSSQAQIIGANNTGGLIGKMSSTVIQNSVSKGSVTGATNVGGLVGLNDGIISLIANSYSLSDVLSSSGVAGGLVGFSAGELPFDGFNTGYLSLFNSYSAGDVQGVTYSGGNLGGADLVENVDVFDSYWDSQSSGTSVSYAGSVPRTTSEMVQQSTFTNWDFDTVWKITDGVTYPCLLWEDGCVVPETITPLLGCTDSSATNYNPSANQNDGSCTYDEISGSINGTFYLTASYNGNKIAQSEYRVIEFRESGSASTPITSFNTCEPFDINMTQINYLDVTNNSVETRFNYNNGDSHLQTFGDDIFFDDKASGDTTISFNLIDALHYFGDNFSISIDADGDYDDAESGSSTTRADIEVRFGSYLVRAYEDGAGAGSNSRVDMDIYDFVNESGVIKATVSITSAEEITIGSTVLTQSSLTQEITISEFNTTIDADGDGNDRGDSSITFNGGTSLFCPGVPVPTCSDGIQNQDETGIDCGGVCGACGGTAIDGNICITGDWTEVSLGATGPCTQPPSTPSYSVSCVPTNPASVYCDIGSTLQVTRQCIDDSVPEVNIIYNNYECQ